MAIQTPLQVPLLRNNHKKLQQASMQRPHPNVSLTMLLQMRRTTKIRKSMQMYPVSPLKVKTLTQWYRLRKVQLKYRAAFDCHTCHTLTLPIYKNCEILIADTQEVSKNDVIPSQHWYKSQTLNFSHSAFNPVNASG